MHKDSSGKFVDPSLTSTIVVIIERKIYKLYFTKSMNKWLLPRVKVKKYNLFMLVLISRTLCSCALDITGEAFMQFRLQHYWLNLTMILEILWGALEISNIILRNLNSDHISVNCNNKNFHAICSHYVLLQLIRENGIHGWSKRWGFCLHLG